MLTSYLGLTALTYGLLYRVYPHLLFSVIEWGVRQGYSHVWASLGETFLLVAIAMACSSIVVRVWGRLMPGRAEPSNGRTLVAVGITLLVAWRFGNVVVLEFFRITGLPHWTSLSRELRELLWSAIPPRDSTVLFWIAMSLVIAGVLRSLLPAKEKAAAEA